MKISNVVNTQKLNNILKDPRTNWKYIIIVAILAFIAGAIIMNCLSKTGFEIPIIKLPERVIKEAENESIECYKDPRKALDDFLTFLYDGEYEKAAEIYYRENDLGGYPNQRSFPPEATEEERTKIEAKGLADFCYGYRTCLRHEIISEERISEKEVLFGVRFFEENGEVFELVMPPWVEEEKRYATEFGFKIKKINGCYKNLSAPPMTP